MSGLVRAGQALSELWREVEAGHLEWRSPVPELRPVIHLDDFRPCDESGDVDVRRYAPSRVDVGALRRRALFIVQAWVLEHGAVEGALPERLCRVISDMVHAHCRAVQRAETSPDGKVSFSTRDDLGEVSYGFQVPLAGLVNW